jgi:repressor LexA
MRRKADYLTERQKEILEYIEEFRDQEGIAPTHREICEHFGYSSYGTVYKHLKLLAQKGYLWRDWNQKRGLQLLKGAPGRKAARAVSAAGIRELPFEGLIAAGRPIEALPGNERLGVPEHLLGRRLGPHYVLRVVGDSMIDEGIHDGDLVVVQSREEAEPGEMVVALVGNEATLKRFYPEKRERRVRLQPANPQMKPIYVPAGDVKVQGIVVGLMRRF